MIIVGDVPVGKSHFGKSLFDKKGFAFYEKVIGIAHDNDCKVCAQLHQSDSNIKAMLKYVPGVLTKRINMQELRPLLNNEVAPYITNMPHKKVKEITSAFCTAAVLAKKAGFDMIQIHGDRMCGSFSSSIYNHRTDEYGGTAENRARFAVEAVSAVREKLPDMPIDYKLFFHKIRIGKSADTTDRKIGVLSYLITEFQETSRFTKIRMVFWWDGILKIRMVCECDMEACNACFFKHWNK